MDHAIGVRKPRLVFFQWDHQPNEGAARFLLMHMQHHVKCLAQFFDVTVINHDCDYAEICERHRPDLTLFESGYRTHGSRRIKVSNTRTHPDVPKLGLHNGDAWCDRRAGFISDMDHWGIETCFTIAVAMKEYTPSIADRLFVWPNFIDPDIFRDYGQHKTIPVLLTGQAYGLYPWRQKVYRLLADRFPSLICPQFGYESRAARRMLHGEDYARAINASLFVPSCGAMGREVVRKHFEVPAARSCLVTERTPALADAGFVHMENCVFADETDVVDCIDHLLDRPDELRRITDAGYRLVHTRHTLQQRSQILQWYLLNRQRAPQQRIVQPHAFAALTLTDEDAGRINAPVVGQSLDRSLLRQGDAHLWQGRIAAAQHHYRRCLYHVHYLPEARFRLALSSLFAGDAGDALARLAGLIETTLVDYGAADPDPVEWAYFIVALLCQGRIDDAARCSAQYPWLHHPELDRARQAAWRLFPAASPATRTDHASLRHSVHQLPPRSAAAWEGQLAAVLRACGQEALVDRLAGSAELGPAAFEPGLAATANAPAVCGLYRRWYRGMDALLAKPSLAALQPSVPAMPEFRYFGKLGRNVVKATLPVPLRRRLRDLASIAGRLHRPRWIARQPDGSDRWIHDRLVAQGCRMVLIIQSDQPASDYLGQETLICTRIAASGPGLDLRAADSGRPFDAVVVEDAAIVDDRIMTLLLSVPVVVLKDIYRTDAAWAAFEAIRSHDRYRIIDIDPAAPAGCVIAKLPEGIARAAGQGTSVRKACSTEDRVRPQVVPVSVQPSSEVASSKVGGTGHGSGPRDIQVGQGHAGAVYRP